MPMIVDSALVTRKGKGAQYNTGSINASGKTWEREKIHGDKGVFVAGRAENEPFYAVATSGVKGIAETASTLFNDFASVLNNSVENRSEVLSSFFKTFSDFIKDNASLEPSSFSMAVFAGRNDSVHIGISGSGAAYRISNGKVYPVLPEMLVYDDGVTGYGAVEIPNVDSGDIFLLFGEEAAAELTQDTVAEVCASADSDIQLILRRLASAAISVAPQKSITLAAVKILDTEPLPVIPAADEVIVDEKTTFTDEAAVSEPQAENSSTENAGKKRTAGFIVVASILAVLVLALGIIAIRGIIYYKGTKNPSSETTTAETTTVEESTTAAEASTTEPETESETTTEAETTTRRAQETTTRRSYQERTTARERNTQASTERATDAPTEAPTERVTDTPTEAPTDAPTQAPTEAPTSAEKPTEAEPAVDNR